MGQCLLRVRFLVPWVRHQPTIHVEMSAVVRPMLHLPTVVVHGQMDPGRLVWRTASLSTTTSMAFTIPTRKVVPTTPTIPARLVNLSFATTRLDETRGSKTRHTTLNKVPAYRKTSNGRSELAQCDPEFAVVASHIGRHRLHSCHVWTCLSRYPFLLLNHLVTHQPMSPSYRYHLWAFTQDTTMHSHFPAF